jgi:hypothetical protein
MNTLKTIASLFSSIFLLTSGLVAQPYEQTLTNSSEWTLKSTNLWGSRTDTLHVSGDTIINSTNYKVVKFKNFGPRYFMNEDTTTGKIDYFSSSDSTIKTAIDLSLSLGDTFGFTAAWSSDSIIAVVDSVYNQNNRKHIRFDFELNYAGDERLEFIEGIGSNIGLRYRDRTSVNLNPYLLCYWKNGNKEFSNKYYNGECFEDQVGIGENSPLSQDIKVFPNPAKSTLNVTCEKCTEVAVSIYSGTGKLIRQTKASQQQKRLDISQLRAGFYLVLTETDLGTITKRIVKN